MVINGEKINLEGQKVRLKNGEIAEILEYENRESEKFEHDHDSIYISGKVYSYNLVTVLKKGVIKLVDDELQNKIINWIDGLLPIQQQPKILIRYGTPFGTNAYDAYCKLCSQFGFNFLHASKFEGKGRPLCASNVTKEGHGVWFICYSNLNNSKDIHWTNDFSKDESIITETWTEDTYRTYAEQGDIRLVFARKKKSRIADSYGVYEFLGLYQCMKKDDYNRIAIYERISENYEEE